MFYERNFGVLFGLRLEFIATQTASFAVRSTRSATAYAKSLNRISLNYPEKANPFRLNRLIRASGFQLDPCNRRLFVRVICNEKGAVYLMCHKKKKHALFLNFIFVLLSDICRFSRCTCNFDGEFLEQQAVDRSSRINQHSLHSDEGLKALFDSICI